MGTLRATVGDMTTREDTAAWLDKQGITVTNAIDPVDGSTIAVVDVDQLAKLVKPAPTQMWLNAMHLVAPRDEFIHSTGKEIIDMLMESPRPEKDEYGLAPYRRLDIRLVAS